MGIAINLLTLLAVLGGNASEIQNIPVVYCDLTALAALDLKDPAQRRQYWDETHFAAALQGLANRENACCYLRYNAEPDDFWWERAQETEDWLTGRRVVEAAGVDDLLRHFRNTVQGVVVWDERVPATSNLASTIAGVENLLPLRYDPAPHSLYTRLTTGNDALPILRRLIATNGEPLFTATGTIPGTDLPSTGSAKCDAYRWLIEGYVRTGKVNVQRLGYYLDAFWFEAWQAAAPRTTPLTNHDFIIARGGLVFDLGVWDDEAPVDDPGQRPGTDAETLRCLMAAVNEQLGPEGMIHVAGFVPWAYKYTNSGIAGGHHDPVPTEWRYAEILSCFNAYMDADALGYSAMANASFFQHFPLPARIPQNPKPTLNDLRAQGFIDAEGRVAPRKFVAHYVGDYDSAAWLYWKLPGFWQDPARGQVPLNWAFNPNLADRLPLGMAWARETRTDRDCFVAGDSGAGYLNPGLLVGERPYSGLPSGLARWEKHCSRYYQQWDLSITGFIIDGYGPAMTPEVLDAYGRFSPDGIVPQKVPPQSMHGDMPVLRMGADLPHDPEQAARTITGALARPGAGFGVFRSILKAPAWYVEVGEALNRVGGEDFVVVDMHTLMRLMRQYLEHPELQKALPSPYANASFIRATPRQAEGLRPVYLPDGRFEEVLKQDVTAWKVPAGEYLYFDADDQFLPKTSSPVTVEVHFLDKGTDDFVLHYDSTDTSAPGDGAYKETSPIARSNTGAWKTIAINLPDTQFSGRQNGNADLRIASGDTPLTIAQITVRRNP